MFLVPSLSTAGPSLDDMSSGTWRKRKRLHAAVDEAGHLVLVGSLAGSFGIIQMQ